MASTEDSDIPESGAVFTFGKSNFAENVPNKFWVKNDKVHEVVCGDEHTALLTDSGRIFVFGSNSMGQLGLGSIKSAVKPSCIKSLKSEKVKLVACGRYHSIVATESGKLYTFGANNEGQLGVEGIQDSYTPVHLEALDATQYSMLQAGTEHSVALTEDGRVFVWGGGGEGQLGLGQDSEAPTPRELLFDENVVCIACGYYHTAVVTESGSLYTFGETEGGKLGLDNNPAEYSTPQHVSSIDEKVKWVACGGSHTAALTETGKVYTFGGGPNGQLGHGTVTLQTSVPLLLKVEFKIAKISCGENITAMVSERGQLYTFGDGRHGKLAQGEESFSNQFRPCRVDRFTKFSVEKAACGGCHMIVTAHRRTEGGEEEVAEEIEEAERTLNSSFRGIDLNGSVPARIRRRQTMSEASPHKDLNRTLPTLGNNRKLPTLNGHATMPYNKNQQNLLGDTIIQGASIETEMKRKKTKSESGSENEKDLSDPEDEGEGGRGDEPHPPGDKPQPPEDHWSSDGEKDEVTQNGVKDGEEADEEMSEDEERIEEIKDEPRLAAGPVPTPRKNKDEKKESEDEEDEEDEEEEVEEEVKEEVKKKEDKKDKKKDKDKKKKKGFFSKQKNVDSEEEDEEKEEEEEEEGKGKKKNKKDKKDKDKKKDKKKNKKKGKKDEDEEEDEEEEDEEEEVKTDKKDKKKKDKKDKKKDKKNKKGKKDEDEDEEEKDEEDVHEGKNEDKTDVKKDDKDKKEEKPVKKKSKFCTIL